MALRNAQRKRSPLKDTPLRYAGQSLDSEIERVRWDIAGYAALAFFLVTVAILEWWHLYKNLPPQPAVAMVLAVAAIGYSYLRISRLRKRLPRLELARDGERIVAESLDDLRGQGCAIFHDVVAKDFNIDHVIVSRSGVFAVETKTYSKPALKGYTPTVKFNGEKVAICGMRPDDRPVRQVVANADWLRGTLRESTGKSFHVTPVLLFTDWWVEETNNGGKIWVLNQRRLANKISEEPVRLSESDVHLAAFHLSRLVRMST